MIWLNDLKFVNVWAVDHKENFTKARLQTSEKKQDGTYENSDWYASFVGKCADQAKQLSDGARINVTHGKITNVYNKEAKKSYLNFTVFAFEITKQGKDSPSNQPAFDEDDFSSFRQIDDSDEIPFL